jgi:hypothetical protein
MYDEQLLINRIKAQTPYTKVVLAEDTQIDFTGYSQTTPYIVVGHIGIKLQFPETLWRNGYNELENNAILITNIQFLCPRDSLATVRTNIANAYKNWNPFGTEESNYSALVFIDADLVAKTNNKVWWKETVGLIMPQIT